MNYHTETKPQCWRAVAVFDDRPEVMLYLNRSSPQVRSGLRSAYFDLLDDAERSHVVDVVLQRWHGAPDAGRWLNQCSMPIPTREKLVAAA